MMRLCHRLIGIFFIVILLTCSSTVSYAQNPNSLESGGQIAGVKVSFTSGATRVDVTLSSDNPTVRDFLSLLPVTIKLEEFAGREKIGYFDRKLNTKGSPGSDPEDGDLIYFTPWGNIGFYYNASGIGFSDQTIPIGTFKASRAELDQLANGPVRIERVR